MARTPDPAAVEAREMARHLFSDADFAGLFTDDALAPLRPRVGADGQPPFLVAHVLTPNGQRDAYGLVLLVETWNEWEDRQATMREIGQRMAAEGWAVIALQLVCEAWMKTLTDAEYRERQGRPVAEYPDKEEVVVVMGLTLDGRCRMAMAPLVRDAATGAILDVGPWQHLSDPGDARSPLLETAYTSYLRHKSRHHRPARRHRR